MADEKASSAASESSGAAGSPAEGGKKKKRGKVLLLVLLPVLLGVGAGGYFAYARFAAGKGGPHGAQERGGGKAARPVLFALDPFVVNLSEPGRYLKVSMQFELADSSAEPLVTAKVPILRDAVITLIGGQPYDLVSSPEGKLHLKEEILVRANAVVGREVFRNLYFTDFVMQ